MKSSDSELYWVSFLDGMQRVILFTDDIALAMMAQQVGRFQQLLLSVSLTELIPVTMLAQCIIVSVKQLSGVCPSFCLSCFLFRPHHIYISYRCDLYLAMFMICLSVSLSLVTWMYCGKTRCRLACGVGWATVTMY